VLGNAGAVIWKEGACHAGLRHTRLTKCIIVESVARHKCQSVMCSDRHILNREFQGVRKPLVRPQLNFLFCGSPVACFL